MIPENIGTYWQYFEELRNIGFVSIPRLSGDEGGGEGGAEGGGGEGGGEDGAEGEPRASGE